jgi:murein DD-endopeptidase MepM/ murein hydrolase activator NlpD
MNSLYQSEDAVLEADKVLNKPLVSVLSGEDILAKAPAKSHKERSDKRRRPLFEKKTPENREKRAKNDQPRKDFIIEPFFSPSAVTNITLEAKAPVEIAPAKNRFLLHNIAPTGNTRKILLRAFVVLMIAATMAGASFLAATLISHPHPVISLPNEDSAQEALMAMLEPEPSAPPSGDTALPPLPSLLVERTYTVRRGDSLQTIARQFGLREDTIISANGLSSKNQLQVGKTLKVPNMNGVYHTVKRNENLSVIARAYGVDMTRIADANNISSSTIRVGDRLFIPNAKLDASVLRNFYGETFIWPVRGPISSPFGYRINPFSGQRTFHAAIDIVVNKGTSVKATREGKVADTGYNAVFGNYVIIRHADGYQSLYAHLNTVLTHKGASVNQGEVIGRSGNTGQSTGPHLHFSIFRNGQAVDPRKYLK